jgi:Spy/CpxP family protein refolding chaperone
MRVHRSSKLSYRDQTSMSVMPRKRGQCLRVPRAEADEAALAKLTPEQRQQYEEAMKDPEVCHNWLTSLFLAC